MSEADESSGTGGRVVAIAVTPEGLVDSRFGRAPDVAIAIVRGDEVVNWRVEHVDWGILHDQSDHRLHHARVVRFMVGNEVTVVAASEIGGGMLHTLGKLGLQIVLGVPSGMPAREAVVAVVRHIGAGS